MDPTTPSSSGGALPLQPLRPSPLSYTFHLDDFSSQTAQQYQYGESDEHNNIKTRSCLPGYPSQRSSTLHEPSTRHVPQQRRSSPSTARSNHHRDTGIQQHPLTDDIYMMEHLAIHPSTSMPVRTNRPAPAVANDDHHHDLYRNHRDHRNGPGRPMAARGTPQQQRRTRHNSAISRSATAALATPRSSSRGRNNAQHHQSYSSSSPLHNSNSTASQSGLATTSASPSKRSSSRISFSSQLSSTGTVTAPSIHDIDDNGTVSTRKSENSLHQQRQHYRHPMKPPSPMTGTTNVSSGRKLASNQSVGSTTTKSSSGTNAMGNNTEARSQHRVGTAATRQKRTKDAAAVPSSPSGMVDVDTMKYHIQETRRVIDDLHRSYGASNGRRHFALTNACNLFDHTIEQLHNIEVSNGALTVVSKHLFLHIERQLPEARHNYNADEILYLILSAAEMISRSAPSSFMNACSKIAKMPSSTNDNTSNDEGVVSFISCMLRLLDRLETDIQSNSNRTIVTAANNVQDDEGLILLHTECVHCIGRILISMSRSSDFRIIFHQHHDLVKGLTRISSVKTKEAVTMTTNSECRLCRLHVLANLTKNSNNEHRELLYRFDGFLDSLLRYGNFDPISAIRQAAAWCILELTNAASNCTAMAQNTKVLGTLVKMILVDDSANPLLASSTFASTRESALTALQNISFDRSNRPHVIQFKNGIVLEALKETLTSDIDDKARRRAAGTIVNLVCEDTSEFIASYKGLPDTLALVATQDNNTDVQTRAALSLTKLAVHVSDLQKHPTELSPTYLKVLDALVVTSLSKLHSTRVTAAIRSLVRMHPDHRPLLARHEGIVDTLIDVIKLSLVAVDENITDDDNDATNEPNDTLKITERINAIHAVAHLANSDDGTRKHLCGRPTLLMAMVHATKAPDCQELAIVVLERLATVPSNRYTLSRCDGLIVAVAEAVEREARREGQQRHRVTTDQRHRSEKRCDDEDICSDDGKSIPHGHGYLAKALLMSILVAM